MRAVRTAKSIAGSLLQLLLNMLQIVRRQHHVGVKNEQVSALGAGGRIIARGAGAGIGLGKIADVKTAGISPNHIRTRAGGAIVHHNHLEIGKTLTGQAFEQLAHLVRTVINGNENRIGHVMNRIGCNVTQTPHAAPLRLQIYRKYAESVGSGQLNSYAAACSAVRLSSLPLNPP